MSKRWHTALRWLSNMHTYLVPWESKIKRIESHFGSVVSSYFTFLRWVIFMNVVITLCLLAFIVFPEVGRALQYAIVGLGAGAGRRDR